ncbi:MAG: glycoside hydrolase family 44 protein [Panacagrimonas sp.]
MPGAALMLVLTGALWPAANAVAARGPALAVDTRADRRAISPDIYGLTFADPALAAELSLPLNRWGGNLVERYNWRLGAVNTASDYYYENIGDCFYFETGCAGGNTPYYRTFVASNLARGTQALMQLPMMGYVAKDAPTQHPFTCSFPRSRFPDQQSFDPFDPVCGNGISSSGVLLSAARARANLAVGPGFAADWVRDLKARYGAAAAGGVKFYELGNEPALWNETHRDAHPHPVTYDELFAKSRDLALAVKQADPGAQILAFSEWGWPNYFCSAADNSRENGCFPNSPDRAAHGGIPLADWLLQQFRDHQQRSGQRLIDYFDLHYYRQGGRSADVTRSLWDPGFTDPSYIDDTIALLPRMRELVANNYPGTRIALTEYNLSVPGNPTLNAIIQADVLGIFAREGLDLAARFRTQDDGTGNALDGIDDAYRLYRNYDGAGSGFGDTYVRSTSADQRKLSIYSALRSTDGRLTIVVINKTARALSSRLTLTGGIPAGKAQVWRWTGDGIQSQARQTLNRRPIEYPPLSMTLYVVRIR